MLVDIYCPNWFTYTARGERGQRLGGGEANEGSDCEEGPHSGRGQANGSK